MRISDWSSDVCSSDLTTIYNFSIAHATLRKLIPMASRLHIAEPSIDHLEAAEDALRGAQIDQPAQSREAAGLHIAAAWVGEQDGSIDGLGERRLELALARVLDRKSTRLNSSH